MPVRGERATDGRGGPLERPPQLASRSRRRDSDDMALGMAGAVGSPRGYTRATPEYASLGFSPKSGASPRGGPDLAGQNERLRQALDLEEMETARLEKALKEAQGQLQRTQRTVDQLEEDMAGKTGEVEQLRAEVAAVKREAAAARRKHHELEDENSRTLMNYINEQQQWLDKEAAWQQREAALLAAVEAAEKAASGAAKSEGLPPPVATGVANASLAGGGPPPPSPAASVFSMGAASAVSTSSSTASKTRKGSDSHDGAHARMELDMVKQQMELVTKESALRLERLNEENAHLRELNGRLMEENEGFQLLVAEKTVTGDIQTAGGSSLAAQLAAAEEAAAEADADAEADAATDDATGTGTGPETETAKTTDSETARTIRALQLENKALQNHNRALVLSLERLVNRLLDHKDFAHVVETVPARSVSAFQERVRSASQQQAPIPASGMLSVPRRRGGRSPTGTTTPTPAKGGGTSPAPAAAAHGGGLWGLVPSIWGTGAGAGSGAPVGPAGANPRANTPTPQGTLTTHHPQPRRVGIPSLFAAGAGTTPQHLRGTSSSTEEQADRSPGGSSISSSSSVVSTDGESIISAIDSISSATPRKATASQTKLRPLKLTSPPPQ